MLNPTLTSLWLSVCLSVYVRACVCHHHSPTEIQGREVRRHPQVEAAQPELGGLSPQDHQSRWNRVSHHRCRGNAVPDVIAAISFFLLRHTGVLGSRWHTHVHKQTHTFAPWRTPKEHLGFFWFFGSPHLIALMFASCLKAIYSSCDDVATSCKKMSLIIITFAALTCLCAEKKKKNSTPTFFLSCFMFMI